MYLLCSRGPCRSRGRGRSCHNVCHRPSLALQPAARESTLHRLSFMSRSGARRTRRARVPAQSLLVVLAALAGLFAMHGLSDHGAMRHEVMVSSHDVVASTPMALTGTKLATRDVTVISGTGLPGGPLSMAAGLCWAVLVGIGLVLLARARPSRGYISSHTVLRRWHGRPGRVRAPDPPDLVSLSIQRC